MCLHPTIYLQMYAYCNCTRDEYNGLTGLEMQTMSFDLTFCRHLQWFVTDHEIPDDACTKGAEEDL